METTPEDDKIKKQAVSLSSARIIIGQFRNQRGITVDQRHLQKYACCRVCLAVNLLTSSVSSKSPRTANRSVSWGKIHILSTRNEYENKSAGMASTFLKVKIRDL